MPSDRPAGSSGRSAAPVFVVKFVPLPGRGWSDVNARRRRLLKFALRACGLRCVGLAEEPDRDAGADRPP